LQVAREATAQLAVLQSLEQNDASIPAMDRLMEEQRNLVRQAASEAHDILNSIPKVSSHEVSIWVFKTSADFYKIRS
jgi:hypothetical protein